jgi:hypothetical protein
MERGLVPVCPIIVHHSVLVLINEILDDKHAHIQTHLGEKKSNKKLSALCHHVVVCNEGAANAYDDVENEQREGKVVAVRK